MLFGLSSTTFSFSLFSPSVCGLKNVNEKAFIYSKVANLTRCPTYGCGFTRKCSNLISPLALTVTVRTLLLKKSIRRGAAWMTALFEPLEMTISLSDFSLTLILQFVSSQKKSIGQSLKITLTCLELLDL